jgi:hypothetical protein
MPGSISPRDLTPTTKHRGEWAYRTKRFSLLGYDFALRCTDEALGRYVDEAFGGCASPGQPTTWYSIIDQLPGHNSYAIFAGETQVMSTGWPDVLVAYLTWDVNRKAIAAGAESHVVVHASAAAKGGLGIVFPAAMEGGKTTLVAGLVRAGFDYLSDEAAAINWRTGQVDPFAKPLSIDAGSWPLFPDVKPKLPGPAAEFAAKQWQVSPTTLRPQSVSDAVPVRLVVFPKYVRGARTTTHRIVRPTDAMLMLLQQTFNFHDQPERNIRALAKVIEGSEHFQLTVGDLHEACEAVECLLDTL